MPWIHNHCVLFLLNQQPPAYTPYSSVPQDEELLRKESEIAQREKELAEREARLARNADRKSSVHQEAHILVHLVPLALSTL